MIEEVREQLSVDELNQQGLLMLRDFASEQLHHATFLTEEKRQELRKKLESVEFRHKETVQLPQLSLGQEDLVATDNMWKRVCRLLSKPRLAWLGLLLMLLCFVVGWLIYRNGSFPGDSKPEHPRIVKQPSKKERLGRPLVTGLRCTNYQSGRKATCEIKGLRFGRSDRKKSWVECLQIKESWQVNDTTWMVRGRWICQCHTKIISANIAGTKRDYRSPHRLQECPGSCDKVCRVCKKFEYDYNVTWSCSGRPIRRQPTPKEAVCLQIKSISNQEQRWRVCKKDGNFKEDVWLGLEDFKNGRYLLQKLREPVAGKSCSAWHSAELDYLSFGKKYTGELVGRLVSPYSCSKRAFDLKPGCPGLLLRTGFIRVRKRCLQWQE